MSLISRKEIIKDALVALSLSFLVFIRVWNALLNPSYNQYFNDTFRNRLDYLAAIINTVAVGLLFFVVGRAIRRRALAKEINVAYLAMFAALAPMADFVRRLGSNRFTSLQEIGWWQVICFGVLTFSFGFVFRRWVGRWIYVGALALGPFVTLSIVHALYWSVSGSIRAGAGREVSFGDSTPSKSRVIWLVFDELDQRVAFEARPPGLTLPNLDRLRAESLYATSAYPPAGLTFLSIPSLLTGRIVTRAAIQNDRELQLEYLGAGHKETFPNEHTGFNDLQAQGRRVAVLGWFFPYARMFPRSPTCYSRSFAFPQTQGYTGNSLREAVMWQYLFSFAPPLLRVRFRNVFENLHTATMAVIKSPSADLVFAHYSVPHFPGVAEEGETNYRPSFSRDANAYFSNLSFVDRVIGDVFSAVACSEIAERTTIIVTSDHWWRSAPIYDGRLDYRVPLLVRTSDRTSSDFVRTVNNVCVMELAKAVIEGSIKGNDGVRDVLAKHAGPRTYRFGGGGQMLP